MRKFLIVSIVLALVLGAGFVVKAGGDNDESVAMRLIGVIEKLIAQNDKLIVQNDNKASGNMGFNAQYESVVVTKLIAFSSLTTTGADVTNQVTGDFFVDNVIIETNYATIASGTNFQIQTSGDGYGTSTVLFNKPINCMGRATAWDLNSPTSASCALSATSTQRVLLEDGSKLIAVCTTASCKNSTDGATAAIDEDTGYVRVTTILKRASEYSTTFE